jgi:GMP synthase (glutamine-hydrolysing)
MILIINYGSQVAHLISRRIREFNVYTEILPYNTGIEKIKKLNPNGIILSGGPSGVYEKDAPISDKKILDLNIPVLGICYGHQLLSKQLGGKVTSNTIKEYGKKDLNILDNKNLLLKDLKEIEQVWMSHADLVKEIPNGFKTIAKTNTCENAIIKKDNIYGVQFHPEVTHTLCGNKILKNFVFEICHSKKDFIIKDLPEKIISNIKKIVRNDSVILGISGGVDSTVTAVLINKAIGKRLHAIYIDNGLMRKDETKKVKKQYDKLNLSVNYVNASNLFLEKLKGITDPEEKRKIIGHTFIDVFNNEVKKLEGIDNNIKFLAMGTIYPDRIESAEPNNEASKIKSHHNVTLPKDMKLKILEPIKDLYKDGVRKLGEELNVLKELLYRHPFPGPGLAIRILGEITKDKLEILKQADDIFISELINNHLYDKVWQAFAALLPVKSVGVMGDSRTYEYIITLRAVTSIDAMSADWSKLPNEFLENVSNRIINEVNGVNRVLYDITQKPPGTIEYE